MYLVIDRLICCEPPFTVGYSGELRTSKYPPKFGMGYSTVPASVMLSDYTDLGRGVMPEGPLWSKCRQS